MPQAMPNLETLNVYQPRNPQAGGYYKCVESHFEELEQIWDDHYASRFGFWREYVTRVIHRHTAIFRLHHGSRPRILRRPFGMRFFPCSRKRVKSPMPSSKT